MPVQVAPASADRRDDLVTVFGRRGEDPSWCWCQLFLSSPAGRPAAPGGMADNRRALRQEIAHAAVPPGLIAYVEGRPVGWTRVGPRSALPRVGANRVLARMLGKSPDAWWVACLAMDSHHRRSGVGTALLESAVSYARDHGATAVEGHPVDVAVLKASRVSESALWDRGDVRRRGLLRGGADLPQPAGDAPHDVTSTPLIGEQASQLSQ